MESALKSIVPIRLPQCAEVSRSQFICQRWTLMVPLRNVRKTSLARCRQSLTIDSSSCLLWKVRHRCSHTMSAQVQDCNNGTQANVPIHCNRVNPQGCYQRFDICSLIVMSSTRRWSTCYLIYLLISVLWC